MTDKLTTWITLQSLTSSLFDYAGLFLNNKTGTTVTQPRVSTVCPSGPVARLTVSQVA